MAPVPENRAAGILWMLATMLCFISLDATMKHLLEAYSLVQVTWARFFFATLAAVAVCGRRLPALAVSRAPKLQLLRSVLLMTTTAVFNLGIRDTPLATATTIMFLSPIIVTLLSIVLLGEHVGPRRWAGIVTGFIGALIVVHPWTEGLDSVQIGVLWFLAASLLNACYQIATRYLRGEDPLTSLLYTAALGALVSSAAVPFHWSWPTPAAWGLMILSGLFGALGHLCLIRAFQAAPASVVAPFSYSSLVWAALFGVIIFGEWPDQWTLGGAVLIIASGLYIFYRERKLKGEAGS